MGVKLVAFDIDGTIVRPGEDVPSPRLSAAIRQLHENGIAVILASGRMFPGTIAVARHLGLSSPVVCQQGCSVHLPNGTMIHEFPIERETALEIVDYSRQIDRVFEWFNPVRYLASKWNEDSEEYARLSGIVPEYRPDPERAGVVPTGVGIISTRAEANGIHNHLVGLHGDSLHVLDFPTVTVAVSAEANKGHALSLLCADLGIDRHDVVAIGDSVNDAPMLAWAGHGLALAHSDRYALDAADSVLAEEGDEPLATFLEGIARVRR